jgi:hypothetical protein
MVDAQGPDDPPTPSHYPGTLMHTAVPGAAELSRAMRWAYLSSQESPKRRSISRGEIFAMGSHATC